MKLIPLTTRPSLTSRHAMTRLASTFAADPFTCNCCATKSCEIGYDLQADLAGFFRVELYAEYIFNFNRRDERQSVVAHRRCRTPGASALLRREVIRMREIDKRGRGDSFKQAAARRDFQPVPSHMRNFQRVRKPFPKSDRKNT